MLRPSTALNRPLGDVRTSCPESPVAPSAPQAEAASPKKSPVGLLTPDEVRLRLGVTPKALERWRGSGEGPLFVRLSRKTIRYRAADVDTFVNGRVVASTAA
jgi:hypothetical protein